MTKAADRAYDAIRSRILAGEYPPGSHLKEEQIADDTGVSRTPVREALRRLSAEHLVKFVANRGAYVAHWSASDVDDIFQLRAMLEGYAAACAAQRITAEQIRILDDCADNIEQLSRHRSPENHLRMLELNQRFHTVIVDAAGSERLMVMLAWLVEVPMLLRTYEKFDHAQIARSNHHHREIIAALRARNGDLARKLMEIHILSAQMVFTLRTGQSPPARANASAPEAPATAPAPLPVA
ncbi:MAG: GntR family transcriptional regulator [Gammaproteobacteria bacterium]|nr:GntR family transcriptional regulator [Gammaproteobacteria bacterium]